MRLYNFLELYDKDRTISRKLTILSDRIFKIEDKNKIRSKRYLRLNSTTNNIAVLHQFTRTKRLKNPTVGQVIGAYEVGVGASCFLASWLAFPSFVSGGVLLPAEALALGMCGTNGALLLAAEGVNKMFSLW